MKCSLGPCRQRAADNEMGLCPECWRAFLELLRMPKAWVN